MRRDPRAEPESVRPRADDAQTFKTPPESEMRIASAARPVDAGSPLEDAGTTPPLRRQIAALQRELSVARAELAREQEDRANDAEQMGTLLDRIAGDDAVTQSLREDLARERAFVEELRHTVQDKYADCNTLRLRLAEVEESLTARELDEAAERHVQTQRAERAEQELSEAKKQLEALRHERASQEAELERVNHLLKTSNIKAFAANRQLESWKAESFRMIEQTRAEQGAALESLAADHTRAIEALRREATAGLAAAAKSLEAIQALALPRAAAAVETSPARAPEPPPLSPQAASRTLPTKPAMPAVLRKKQPTSTPSLEVAELDVCPEDLIEELMSKGD